MRDVLAGVRQFEFSDVRTFPTDNPDVIFAEFTGNATVVSTGCKYSQEYIVRLETRNGEIVYYREYWNPLEVLNAFDPGRLTGKFDVVIRPAGTCE
jgi:ketosteroid isomerase-like protein